MAAVARLRACEVSRQTPRIRSFAHCRRARGRQAGLQPVLHDFTTARPLNRETASTR